MIAARGRWCRRAVSAGIDRHWNRSTCLSFWHQAAPASSRKTSAAAVLAAGAAAATAVATVTAAITLADAPSGSSSSSHTDGAVYISAPAAHAPSEASLWSQILSLVGVRPAPPAHVPLPLDKLTCKLVGPGGGRGAGPPPAGPLVLVSCGSFNPPTIMHLRMFELAADALGRAGHDVWGGFLSPVHDEYRKPGLLPAAQRLDMARAAAAGSALVAVDEWEAAQPGYQRTLAVLRSVAARLDEQLGGGTNAAGGAAGATGDGGTQRAGAAEPSGQAAAGGGGGSGVRVALLCGGDLVESMAVPGVWVESQLRELLTEHGVVAITRSGSRLRELLEEDGGVLHELRDRVIVVEEPVRNNISSTLLRQLVAQGESIRYLTPDAVVTYIEQHNLYKK